MTVDRTTEALIRASVDAALRKVRMPTTRWATVEEHDALSGQLFVVVDGTDGEPIQAIDATATVFAPGQRALVLYTPPQAVHVVGARAASPIFYEPTIENVDLGADYELVGEYLVSDGIVDFSVRAVLGTGASVTGEIRVGLPIEGASEVALATDWLTLARATIGSGRYAGAAVYQPGTDTLTMGAIGGGGGPTWGAGEPAAWSDGDALRLSGRYPMRLPNENIEE